VGLRPQLFREITVTQAHYDELQRRLKELHPDRDSQAYKSFKSDVSSVKLKLIQSFTPAEASSTRILDDNDNRVDDDSDTEASSEDEDEDENENENENEDENEDEDENMDEDEDENEDLDENENENEYEDEDEDKDEDDRELRSLFPSILRFLDLSSLTLKEKVSLRLPLPLLLREEYKHISGLIKEEPVSSAGSIIVSGQPGTGELLVSLSHRI
jgi:hypothetical protein